MGGKAFRLRSLWLGVVAPVALVGLGAPAQAQGIFCPSSVARYGAAYWHNTPKWILYEQRYDQQYIGAFSNASLASQALSDVTQASSQQSTDTVVQAVSARRRTEQVQEETPPSGAARAKIAAARTKPNAHENGAVDIQGPDSTGPIWTTVGSLGRGFWRI